MKLKHAVITSVDRDDLPDGGANHWSNTIREVKKLNPETTLEVLIPEKFLLWYKCEFWLCLQLFYLCKKELSLLHSVICIINIKHKNWLNEFYTKT